MPVITPTRDSKRRSGIPFFFELIRLGFRELEAWSSINFFEILRVAGVPGTGGYKCSANELETGTKRKFRAEGRCVVCSKDGVDILECLTFLIV